MNLEIIHEDNDIILCRKPAGIATQTKRLGQQDMESLLKNYRAKKGETPYIGVVHRLDQPVEGIMVFAKNQKAAAGLSKQIQQRMIGKHYYAVSASMPVEKEGVLENYLVTDKKSNYTSVVDTQIPLSDRRDGRQEARIENPDIKKAVLEYKVIAQKEGLTLFDILLHTGRQHQIRVQMAHMGCPLVGDEKYGAEEKNGGQDAIVMAEAEFSCQREREMRKRNDRFLALCSYRLEFAHPTTGKKMDFSIQPEWEIFG